MCLRRALRTPPGGVAPFVLFSFHTRKRRKHTTVWGRVAPLFSKRTEHVCVPVVVAFGKETNNTKKGALVEYLGKSRTQQIDELEYTCEMHNYLADGTPLQPNLCNRLKMNTCISLIDLMMPTLCM